jgi:hypothetical protein
MRKIVGVGLISCLLLACGRDLTEQNAAARAPPPTADLAAPSEAASGFAKREAAEASKVAAAPAMALLTRQTVQSSSMIIRSGSARIKVDSLDRAIESARVIAARLGGFIAGVNVSGGDAEFRQATLELRIPAAAFDSAVAQLNPLGDVESVQVSAQDVGEDYVDTESRLRNSRRLEERLIDLLARRTGKLEEVLAVERELARVREEIERTEGHLRYLQTRVSLSTLTLNVHEPAPLITQPGDNPIVDAFLQAGRNFVTFIARLIALLGFALPAAVILFALIQLGRRLSRRWKPGFGVSTVGTEAS